MSEINSSSCKNNCQILCCLFVSKIEVSRPSLRHLDSNDAFGCKCKNENRKIGSRAGTTQRTCHLSPLPTLITVSMFSKSVRNYIFLYLLKPANIYTPAYIYSQEINVSRVCLLSATPTCV